SYTDDHPVHSQVSKALAAVSESFSIRTFTNQTAALHGLIEAGAGIGLADPFVYLSLRSPDLVARRFRPAIVMQPRIISALHRPVPGLASGLRQHLAEASAELAARFDRLVAREPRQGSGGRGKRAGGNRAMRMRA